MGYNYRCTNRKACGVRRTFKHMITWYKTRPLCFGCKKDTLKPVYSKEYDRSKKRGCFCQGRGWPHNRGYVIDADRTCIHATRESFSDAIFKHIAEKMGAQTFYMRNDEPCPF